MNGNIDRTKHVENFLFLEDVRAASWKMSYFSFCDFNACKMRKFTVKLANKTNQLCCGANKIQCQSQLKKRKILVEIYLKFSRKLFYF